MPFGKNKTVLWRIVRKIHSTHFLEKIQAYLYSCRLICDNIPWEMCTDAVEWGITVSNIRYFLIYEVCIILVISK